MNNYKYMFYIGSYTEQESKGIYRALLKPDTGEIEIIDNTENFHNPTFLVIHPNKKYLYTADTVIKDATVSAYKIDTPSNNLIKINSVSANGSKPAHIITDNEGKYLLYANFGSGSVCSHKINEDGSIGNLISKIQHTGSSTHPLRQIGPHAHSINLDADNNFAFVADLGTDKLMIYAFDKQTGELKPTEQQYVKTANSQGPRHLTFSPDGKFAYLITEMGSQVYAYKYDKVKGTLKEIQSISTLPKDYHGSNGCAEIQITECGRFLYGSNRGHDTLVGYKVDRKTGKLETIGYFDCGGQAPRHFSFNETGEYIVVANQSSGNLASMKVNYETGHLKLTGFTAKIPEASCIKFFTKKEIK